MFAKFATRKMKKLVIALLAILFVVCALVFWANYRFIGLTRDTFGINYCISRTIFSFDTERDFHGDGFAIDVEQLDSKSQKFFQNPPTDLFIKYPLRHAHFGYFQIFKWRRTPVAVGDTFRTNYGLKINAVDSEGYMLNSDVHVFLQQAEKVLNTRGSYYALCFRDHPYKLYGLDLYIIDPNNGVIYKINRQ